MRAMEKYKHGIIFQNFLDQPVQSDMRTNDNIRNIATGQGDDLTQMFV